MKLLISIIIFFSLQIVYSQDILQKPPNSNKIITSLNFKDTDIRDIFRSIAFEYQTNIMVDNDVNKRISTSLFNIQVFDAIKIISEDNELYFYFDKNRFTIKSKKVLKDSVIAIMDNEPIISFENNNLSIDADNVRIQKLVQILQNKSGKNFLITAGTEGRISGKLKNVDLEIGLKNLLQNNGFLLNITDSIYYISRSSYFSSLDGTQNQNRYKDYWVSAKQKKVTVQVSQVSLDKVITDISQQLNLQIIKLVVPAVNITAKFNELPIDKAFSYLFYGTEFTYKVDDDLFIIGAKNGKNLENTKLIRLKFLRSDKVLTKLPQYLTQSVNVNTSLEHNALIVSGNIESISSLEDYIEVIDKPVPQVLIEAIVVDFNLDNSLQYGIKAGKGDSTTLTKIDNFFPGINVTASGENINKILKDIGSINLFGKEFDIAKLGKLPANFYINLKAMEVAGLVNIKSRPILSTLNGHTASLKIGTIQNYVFNEIMPIQNQYSSSFIERERIEKIEANMSFEITPWIGPNGELTLEIKPEFQTPVGDFNPDKKNIPAINTRTFSSTVRLRDGETIILGGLIQESEIKSEDKFPLLGDIPFIGELFKSVTKQKSKGELIVYLTPKIYYDDNEYSNYNYAE
ncbi:MAG TPA: hypothetical protein VFF33_13310 [Ignavibacteriaceae bacterium]|nr:hypothetical protein [Ignavibacteriaceae bacterium]